jgi:hypothetical protein
MQQNTVSIPAWDHLPGSLTWDEKVAYLAHQFTKLDQTECPLTHSFEKGLYIREIRIPAGSLIVGAVHRHGHVCQLLEGDLILIHRGGVREGFHAPSQLLTEPGYQMVVYAVTDALARTIHPNPTEDRDVARLEAEFFESPQGLIERGANVAQGLLS